MDNKKTLYKSMRKTDRTISASYDPCPNACEMTCMTMGRSYPEANGYRQASPP